MEDRQQALYWAELVDLKVSCEYVRRYRDSLAETMTRFAVIRAIVSVSALGTWAAVKSYPMLWGGIIAAAQVADALQNAIPFTARFRGTNALCATLDALFIAVGWAALRSPPTPRKGLRTPAQPPPMPRAPCPNPPYPPPMNITVPIPDDFAARLGADTNFARRALDALVLEEYRAGRLTRPELRRLLGFATGAEMDGFLKDHAVIESMNYEEFER